MKEQYNTLFGIQTFMLILFLLTQFSFASNNKKGKETLETAPSSIASFVALDIKVVLEGAYSTPNMTTNLTVETTSPYSDALTVGSIPANVVDWVFVELRNKMDSSILESSRSAFLLSNGKVVDTDGLSVVKFYGLTDTQYYIVVKHRNHLGIMSTTAININ